MNNVEISMWEGELLAGRAVVVSWGQGADDDFFPPCSHLCVHPYTSREESSFR